MSNINKQAVQAVADLKAGYTLGHADIAILKSMARQLLAWLEQEPVAYMHHSGQVVTRGECCDDEIFAICCKVETPLYAAPQLPQPAVPDEWRMMCGEWRDETVSIHDASGLIVSGISPNVAGIIVEAHNACRAAMLQGAEPVQGWIPCSERMPEFDTRVLLYFHDYGGHIEGGCIGNEGYGPYHYFFDGDSLRHEPTHWMPMPAAPQQEVKP